MDTQVERRTFLKMAAGVAAGSSAHAATAAESNSAPAGKQKRKIVYINPKVPSIKLPAYEGQRYEAVVPDTLDLAERAALGVHGLTGPLDPDADYELYWYAVFRRNPPIMWHNFNDTVQIQFQESLPLMRLASGSHQNEQVDQRWMEVVIQMQGPDGLLYHTRIGRPWATARIIREQAGSPPPGDHFAVAYLNGWMLAAIALYYETTGDEQWRKLGEKVVDGLTKQAIHRADYAYFTKGIFGINEVSDPNVPQESIDPWMNATFAWISVPLAQFHRATGYRPALDLSGKLARYTRFHGGMFQPDGEFVGIGMHFHGHLYPLLGMLEYGMAAGDREMIEFVEKGYQFALTKTNMNSVVGYVPEATGGTFSETCGVADMIHLALKLSLAGAGDYWDDADRWTRNQLAENQLTSTDWVYEMVKDMPAQPNPTNITRAYCCTEKVLERCLGCFGGRPSANDWEPPGGGDIMHCCTGTGTRAIYYVWENILHCKDGKLKVNLLMNRASPWADVDSFIPYEGRVDVKLKTACELSVRIPEWVSSQQTRCELNGKKHSLSWDGRYAVVGKVDPNDVATLWFPISERTDVVRIMGKDYTLIRKGNDVVHIDPPGKYCPLYQREKYRDNKVRTKTVERFVANQQVAW